jgi:hypothetical protein
MHLIRECRDICRLYKPNEKTIVISARSGLSNRLRAMVGVRAPSANERGSCLIHWEKHGSCFAEFQNLYDP